MVDLYELSKKVPLLTQEHTLEPLWGDDTGRNSNSGVFSGTFKGYFSQIVVEFAKTTQEQLTLIKDEFEHSVINVRYKDSNTGNWISEEFYGTAIKAKLNEWEGKYLPFSITLTAIREYEK